MASGYITSDGKDLDERYLGIDTPAKLAERATVADSVSTLAGTTPVVSTAQMPVSVSAYSSNASNSWTAPSHGVLFATLTCYGYINNIAGIYFRDQLITSSKGQHSLEVKWAVKQGDVIRTTARGSGYPNGVQGTFFPWAFE